MLHEEQGYPNWRHDRVLDESRQTLPNAQSLSRSSPLPASTAHAKPERPIAASRRLAYGKPAIRVTWCNNRGMVTFLAVLLALTVIARVLVLEPGPDVGFTRPRPWRRLASETWPTYSNASSEAFVSFDADGRDHVVECERRATPGLERPEVMGKKHDRHRHPRFHRRAYEDDHRVAGSAGTRSAIVGHRVDDHRAAPRRSRARRSR